MSDEIDFAAATTLFEAVFRLGEVTGRDVLRFFRGAEAPVGWLRPLDRYQKSWGLLAKPDSVALKDGFGLQREFLVLSSSYRELQARVLTARADVLAAVSPGRVQEDLVVFVADDPGAPEMLRRLEEPGDVFMVLRSDQIAEGLASGQPSLLFRRLLQEHLYARDFFDRAGPVHGKEFFGRARLLQDLVAQLKRGNHLGLYGLRKVGKTSIIKSLIDMRNRLAPELIFVHVDLLATPTGARDQLFLIYSIVEQLREAVAPEIQQDLGLELLRSGVRMARFADLGDGENFRNRVDGELRTLLRWADANDRRIVIMLDEIEELFPSPGGHAGYRGYNELLAYLRGLSQSVGPLSLMVVGVNPHISEAQLLGAQKNPMFGFFTTRYVPSLELDDTREMIRVLGRSSGTQFSVGAMEKVFGLLGGHPFLTRRLCSLVIRDLPRPAKIDDAMVEARAEAFLRQEASSFAEVVAVVQDYYPGEFQELQRIAVAGEVAASSIGRQVLAHLEGYQLVEEAGGVVRVRNRMISDWLSGVRRLRKSFTDGGGDGSHPAGEVEEKALVELIRDVELRLRNKIRSVLDRRWGATSDKRIEMSIGPEAFGAAKERMSRSLHTYGERSVDILDFLYIGDLKAIVIGNEWELFRLVFCEKREVSRNLDIIAPVRSELQHFREMGKTEALRARLAAIDIVNALSAEGD